jgi:2-polyprenyl-6-methoxyphenol hydroxylase-like FAD-dependent oxidoreductase
MKCRVRNLEADIPMHGDAGSASSTSVLIIGAGPVGLGLATDLGWRGIDCTVLEQGDGTIYHPRANTVNSRTMEFCRRWGIADRVRSAGAPPDFPPTIIYLTSLQGYELARIERPTHGGDKPLPTTPERSQRCNQLWLDPILKEKASSFPSVSLRYRTRYERYEETADGVVATVTHPETGKEERIAAQYLVACCGGASSVRSALGLKMEGIPVLSHHVNVFVRIEKLWEQHHKGKAAFYFFANELGNSPSLIELDGNSLWRLGLNYGEQRTLPDAAEIAGIMRRLIGPDISYEVISTLPWTCRSIVADRWRKGRVLLAGDAVHQHGPAGGFGMNTGMGDAVDLGWKLEAMVRGWGGEALLGSYEAERRPVAKRNVEEATDNMRRRVKPTSLTDIEAASPAGEATRARMREEILRDKTKQFVSDGIALGYRYENSPVIVPDGTSPPPESASTYVQSSRPGGRAPHAFLPDGRSTIDLFGRGFVLLQFGGDAASTEGLRAAASQRGVPFDVERIDDPTIATLYERSFVLIRPDGHVAWRGDGPPSDPGEVMDEVRGALAQ